MNTEYGKIQCDSIPDGSEKILNAVKKFSNEINYCTQLGDWADLESKYGEEITDELWKVCTKVIVIAEKLELIE